MAFWDRIKKNHWLLPDEDQTLVHIQKGQKLLNENNIDQATTEFQKALQLDNNQIKAHFGLARCFYHSWMHLNRILESGIKKFEPVILNPRDIERVLKCWEQAIAEYNITLELNSNIADAHAELGDLLIGKDKERALMHLQKAVDLDPQNALANWILGQIALKETNLDIAIYRFKKAVHSEPKNPKYWSDLAQTYHKKGNLVEAIGALEHVLGIQPEDTDALCNLGEIFYQKGDLETAKKYWEKFLSLEPFSADAIRIHNIITR